VARAINIVSGDDWDYVEIELDHSNSSESYLLLKLLSLLDLQLVGESRITLTLLTRERKNGEGTEGAEGYRSGAGTAKQEQLELRSCSDQDDRPPGEAGLHSRS